MSTNPDSLEGITESFIAGEPTVNEEVVQKLQESNQTDTGESGTVKPETPVSSIPQSSAQSVPVREEFNPAVHESNPDGTPRLTADGKYRRKRGRKSNSPKSANTATVSAQAVPQTPNIDYRGTAVLLSSLVFNGSVAVFGPAWEPSQAEREQIENAATRYCESQDISDIPPGIALLLCMGMYAVPRLSDSQTKEKLRSIGESLGIVRPKPKVVQNESAPVADTKPVAEPQNNGFFSRIG